MTKQLEHGQAPPTSRPTRPRVAWRWNAYASRKVCGGYGLPDGSLRILTARVVRGFEGSLYWQHEPANDVSWGRRRF